MNQRRALAEIVLTMVLIALCISCVSAMPIYEPQLHPKHVIIMIGDGMGYNHVAAAGMWLNGKAGSLSFERFPVRMGASTFPYGGSYNPTANWADFKCALNGCTDSAAAGTALATGRKTRNGYIGVDQDGRRLQNVLEAAEKLGLSSGVVTTVPLSHATPATFAAHNGGRGNYAEIANEMIFDSRLDVIIGAGHPGFDDSGNAIEPKAFDYVGGPESWAQIVRGRAGNDEDGDGKFDRWVFSDTRQGFRRVAKARIAPRRFLGVLPVASTAQGGRAGDTAAAPFAVPLNPNVPTLAESVKAALNVLDDNTLGFALMVEGGAIDWASHSNLGGRMIEETVDFNTAIEAVVDWVNTNSNWRDTVLIITADHETGYITGPGSGLDGATVWNPLVSNGAGQMPGLQWNSGGHSNSLVPVYAKGHAAQRLSELVEGLDPVRGRYTDNTCVSRTLFDALKR